MYKIHKKAKSMKIFWIKKKKKINVSEPFMTRLYTIFWDKKRLEFNNSEQCNIFNLIKVELELAAMEIMETSLLERIETLALLGFRI